MCSDGIPMNDGFWHFATFEGRLVGSENPAALPQADERIRRIADTYGVTTLVCLTESPPSYTAEDLPTIHRPMRDVCDLARVGATVDEVARRLRAEEIVWVHCERGLDRAACVISGAMVRYGWSHETVVTELRDLLAGRLGDARACDVWEASTGAVIRQM